MKDKIKLLSKKLDFSKFQEIGLVFIIIILCVLVHLRNPAFLTATNISNLFTNVAVLGVLAVGMMLVLLTGGIDLSVGSVMALAGMICALTIRSYPELPVIVVIFQGAAIGAVCGLVTGTLIARFSILPIIASLGMMNILRGLTYIIAGGAWVVAHQMPDNFKNMAQDTFFGINYLILIMILIFIIFTFFINFTRTGRHIYAVGSSSEAADVIGLPSKRIVTTVYVLAGALFGIGGVMWTSRFAVAQGDAAIGYEIFVIAACVLGGVSVSGGRGSIRSLVLGVTLLGILQNALPMIRVSPFWQQAIQGFVILIAITANVLVKRNNDQANLRRRVI